jgi:hypothetical protein
LEYRYIKCIFDNCVEMRRGFQNARQWLDTHLKRPQAFPPNKSKSESGSPNTPPPKESVLLKQGKIAF